METMTTVHERRVGDETFGDKFGERDGGPRAHEPDDNDVAGVRPVDRDQRLPDCEGRTGVCKPDLDTVSTLSEINRSRSRSQSRSGIVTVSKSRS